MCGGRADAEQGRDAAGEKCGEKTKWGQRTCAHRDRAGEEGGIVLRKVVIACQSVKAALPHPGRSNAKILAEPLEVLLLLNVRLCRERVGEWGRGGKGAPTLRPE